MIRDGSCNIVERSQCRMRRIAETLRSAVVVTTGKDLANCMYVDSIFVVVAAKYYNTVTCW